MSKMLTRKEAAKRLDVSLETLDDLRRRGLLAYVQHCPGGKVWVSEDAILECIARSTHKAAPVNPPVNTYRKRRMA